MGIDSTKDCWVEDTCYQAPGVVGPVWRILSLLVKALRAVDGHWGRTASIATLHTMTQGALGLWIQGKRSLRDLSKPISGPDSYNRSFQ